MPVNQPSLARLRFVVLLHQPGPQSERTDRPHFDWMFESDGALRTWATPPIDLRNGPDSIETESVAAESVAAESVEIGCQLLPDHRLVYLDYEGPISRGRGTVTRQAAGGYRLIEDHPDCFRVVLEWQWDGKQRMAEVKIYRNFFREEEGWLEDRRESWRLRFSAGR